MSPVGFDSMTQERATGTSGRQALKLVAATAAGGLLTLVRAGPVSAIGQCRRMGQPCRESAECCSGFCDSATRRCTCGPGTVLCSGTCVTDCQPPFVLDTATCQCQCMTGTTACGSTCCAPGTCANGTC